MSKKKSVTRERRTRELRTAGTSTGTSKGKLPLGDVYNESAPATAEPFAAFIGIDRSDRHLDVCLQIASVQAARPEHRPEQSRIDSRPEALAQWMAELVSRFPGGVLAIRLEQPAPALIAYLSHCPNVVLFPVNPLTLSRYREAFTTSRAKDDAGDAAYLMELVRDHRDKLPVWRRDDARTRSIALLCEGRRKAVDLRTGLGNALLSHLKSYFPQAIELCGDDLYSVLSTACCRVSFFCAGPACRNSSVRARKRCALSTLRTTVAAGRRLKPVGD